MIGKRSFLLVSMLLALAGAAFAQPDQVLDVTALSGPSEGEITLRWTSPNPQDANPAPSNYIVRYATADIPSSDLYAAWVSTYAHSWSGFASNGSEEMRILSGLTPGATLSFAVVAVDAGGGRGDWTSSDESGGLFNSANYACVPDSVPAVVAGQSATPGNGLVTLSWTANTEIDIKRYVIERSSYSSSEGFALLTAVSHPGSSHTDTAVLNGNTYYYKITAEDNTGNFSVYGGTLNARPTVTIVAPSFAFPTHGYSSTTINWSWDLRANASGYRIIDATTLTPLSADLGPSTTFWIQTVLTPNATSFVRVQAFNGLITADSAGYYSYSLAVPPANVTSVETSRSVTLTWSDGGNTPSTRYTVRFSTYADFHVFQMPVSAADVTTYLHSGLEEGVTYYYRLWAVNGDTITVASEYTSYSTATVRVLPGAPFINVASAPGANDGDVTLSWNTPYNDEGDAASGRCQSFVIKWSTMPITEANFDGIAVSSVVAVTVNPPNPQGTTLGGLWPGTTYYFALQAVDGALNYSLISNTWTVPARDRKPNEPTAVTALALSSTTVEVSWTVPSFTGVDDRDRYKVYRASAPFVSFQAVATLSHPTTYYIDPGCAPETTYYYRISGLDTGDAGDGRFSFVLESDLSASTGIVRTPDTTSPDAPPSASAAPGAREGQILLSWTAPGDDGLVGGITDGAFRIDYSTDPATVFAASTYQIERTTTTEAGEVQTCVLTGLEPGATYYIALWMCDETLLNWSALAANASSWVQWDVTAPDPLGSLAASGHWHTADLTWASPGDDGSEKDLVGFFEIRVSTQGPIDNDTKWDEVQIGFPYRVLIATSTPPGTPQRYSLAPLANDTTYHFAIRSIDELGNESALSLSSPEAYPLNHAPGTFAQIYPFDNSISTVSNPTFSWQSTSDADAPYGDYFEYRLYYSTDSALAYPVTMVTHPGTSYSLDLTSYEDRTIFWRVAAVDLDGTMTMTSTSSVRVNVLNTVPAAFSLAGPTDGEIVATLTPTLSWAASSDTDPGDSVSYRVEYSGAEDFATFVTSAGLAGTSLGLPALTENATYWWRVWAVDGTTGTLCDLTFRFKINATPEPPLPFDLTGPSNGAIFTTTTVTFAWQPTPDPDPEQTVTYSLTYWDDKQPGSPTTVAGLMGTTTTFHDLADNTKYWWRVTVTGSDALTRPSNQTASFFTDITKELPSDFELLQPTNCVVSSTLRPIFYWGESFDPDPADEVRYVIEVTPNPDFTGTTPVLVGLDRTYVPLTDLIDQTTYYWRVWAAGYQYQGNPPRPEPVDPGYVYSATGTFVVSMVNNPPDAFTLVWPPHGAAVNTKRPVFRWNRAVDADVNASVGYAIIVSTAADFSVVFDSAAALTELQYEPSIPLLEERTYFWRVTATDNKGATTVCAAPFSFPVPTISTPTAPAGIRGALSADKMKFTIFWSTVTRNVDGSPLDDLAGYQIYRGLSLATMSFYAAVPPGVTSWTDEDTEGGNLHYRVRAVDHSGTKSPAEDSPIIDSLYSTTLSMVSDDRSLTIEIPEAVTEYLCAQNNAYGQDLRLMFEEDTTAENDRVLSHYRIRLVTAEGATVEKVRFEEPLTVRFYYGTGTPAAARFAAAHAPLPAVTDLNVYWHNGIEYVRLGGAGSAGDSTVTLQTIYPGTYELRRVARAPVFGVAGINPPKLFTPGIAPYEKIVFYVDNPAGDKAVGKVYDLRGEYVADLAPVGDPTALSVILEWDGTTPDHERVPKGVYLYQIEGSNRVINGTIMVAR